MQYGDTHSLYMNHITHVKPHNPLILLQPGGGNGEGENWTPPQLQGVLSLWGVWSTWKEHATQWESGWCHVQVGEICKEHSLSQNSQAYLQGIATTVCFCTFPLCPLSSCTCVLQTFVYHNHYVCLLLPSLAETALHKAIHEPKWSDRI